MRSTQVEEVASGRYWREDDARIVVEAWRRAGQPLAKFAEQHGVDPRRVARWATRLKRLEPAVKFHAVRVAQRDDREGIIEIEMRGGRRVRVTHGFDADDLRRVLAVLEERATC